MKNFKNYLNENVSGVDITKYYIKELKNLNYHVGFGIVNNKISLTHSGYNLFNTNNTNLGVENLNRFLAAFVMGMKAGKE